jgi:hypothetical protein
VKSLRVTIFKNDFFLILFYIILKSILNIYLRSASPFGDIAFLSLSTFYDSNIFLSGWSSGTGASGLIGSFAYAGLTSLGLKPRDTILSMLFIPFLPLNNLKEDIDDNNVSNEQEETKSLIKNEPIFFKYFS